MADPYLALEELPMKLRQISAIAAAATAVVLGTGLMLSSTAAAAVISNIDITLNPAHKNQTAEGFGKHECTGPLAALPDGKDGWHFILPSATGEDFVSASLDFKDTADAPVPVAVDNVAPGTTDTGPGWSAFFDDTGAGAWKHLYVITDAGWTLVDGDGVATRDSEKANTYNKTTFNLSHTCPADEPPCTSNCGPPTCDPEIDECNPGTETTTTTTTTTTTATTTTTKPGLAVTGASLTGLVAVGVAMIAGGTALLFLRRRRSAAGE
jgi:LPXTG-motif cell wall-anchored protein